MAATQTQQDPDRTAEDIPADTDNMKEQAVSVKNESVSPNTSQDAAAMGQPGDTVGQLGSFAPGGDRVLQSPDVYAPQPQPFYYKAGYENAAGQWDEYPLYTNAEGFDLGSPAVYNDNSSLLFHGGYGYNPQMPYGPFSPVTTPLPSLGGDAQLFSPQQYPFSGPPYYQPLGPPNMPYITSPSPSHTDLTTLVSVDQHGDSMLYGPQPSYPSPLGSMGGGNFAGSPATLNFHDLQQGFDGTRSGGFWSDFSKPTDRQRSLAPISPAVSPQPIGTPFGQNVGMAPQQQRPLYGIGSGSNTYNRGYPQSGFNQGATYGSASIPGLGINSRGWLSLDNGRRRARGSTSICGCIGGIDILSEQNRGPRASKPKTQIVTEHGTSADSKKDTATVKLHEDSYNRPDFITEYPDAKFFVIKSYSEDNVHKSIKYSVWASTPNGNKKLDAAYREAKEKQDRCPVFLLFSVNASAQFCGVAEMVGPVDFEKSVDCWQQDKWSGQFPVKWHMIKDVPNSHFRHILLENNDNKPVTNSRDTQEVKLEQGIEILNIFKKYENETSILDDFDFYEDREKAMREQKARQQGLMNVGVIGENDHKTAVALSNDFAKNMPKSFAQVVRLDEGIKDVSTAEKASTFSDGSTRTRVKPEDTVTGTVSSA